MTITPRPGAPPDIEARELLRRLIVNLRRGQAGEERPHMKKIISHWITDALRVQTLLEMADEAPVAEPYAVAELG